MVINLYPPEIHSPGQELAPSHSEGCQRVIEPDLSPLLYKSNTPFAKFDRMVSLPNNISKVTAYSVMLQI